MNLGKIFCCTMLIIDLPANLGKLVYHYLGLKQMALAWDSKTGILLMRVCDAKPYFQSYYKYQVEITTVKIHKNELGLVSKFYLLCFMCLL